MRPLAPAWRKVVKFLRYPREGHGIRENKHRLHLEAEQSKWFAEHLPASAGVGEDSKRSDGRD